MLLWKFLLFNKKMFDKLAQKCLKIERGWRMEESNKLGHSSMGKVQVGGWGGGGGGGYLLFYLQEKRIGFWQIFLKLI